MALVLGTNCGFVSVAPSADPAATNAAFDNAARAIKHTSPAGSNRITEIGVWIENATEAGNIQFGLYSDAGAGEPELRLQVSTDIAKGLGGGAWVKATGLLWTLGPSTAYWIAAALADTATTTNTNVNNTGGDGAATKTTTPTLPADWGASSSTVGAGTAAIYAKYEAAGGMPLKLQQNRIRRVS
jgi:hypothetical protein